jgi:hypothetical protein
MLQVFLASPGNYRNRCSDEVAHVWDRSWGAIAIIVCVCLVRGDLAVGLRVTYDQLVNKEFCKSGWVEVLRGNEWSARISNLEGWLLFRGSPCTDWTSQESYFAVTRLL